jgi:hypothetical protein
MNSTKNLSSTLVMRLVLAGLFSVSSALSYSADATRDGGAAASGTEVGHAEIDADKLLGEPLCGDVRSTPRWQLCDPLLDRMNPLALDEADKVLRFGAKDVKTLCEVDTALVHANDACMSSPGVIRSFEFQSLMRRLAERWRANKNLDRADEIYRLLYARSSAPQLHNPLWLWAGDLLQDWTRLKLDQGQRQAALDLIERRVELGRRAYEMEANRTMLRSLVQDLSLQAAILMELGLVDQSQAALQEVETVMARPLPGLMGRSWPSSYIVPKLQPVLDALKREVRAKVPGVRMNTSEPMAPADHSFSLRIKFSAQQIGSGSSGDINIKLDCGAGFNSPPSVQVEDRVGFRTCRSYITQGSGNQEQVLEMGPSIEVSLEDGDQMRHQIDAWAATTIAFFRGSTSLIVARLQRG